MLKNTDVRAARFLCGLLLTLVAASLAAPRSATQTSNFSPANPSKEYVHAGDRLLATEEPVASPPAAPAGLSTAGSPPKRYIWWADNSNNETGFKIEERIVGGATPGQWAVVATAGVNTTSYVPPAQSCDRTYRVRATNDVGDSAFTNEMSLVCWQVISNQHWLTPQPENVFWTNVSPTLQVDGNSLRKSGGTNIWTDGGAVSSRLIASGSGYVEFTPGNTATARMLGLGNGDASAHYMDIEFAFYTAANGELQVYESGQLKVQLGTYAATDRLRVAVDGGAVRYYKNGALVYASAVAASYPLRVDTSLHNVNAQIDNAVIGATSFQGVSAPEDVYWVNVAPTLRVTGSDLQKVSGTNIWSDAGAASSRTIAAGDGYVEFTPGENTTWRLVGLGTGDANWFYTDIEYAFFMSGGGGGLHIYEAGTPRGSFGPYAAGDRLKVAVEGGVVKYYKNGSLVYTSGVAPSYPLRADTSFNTVNAGVYNVKIAATEWGGTPAPENVVWKNVTPTLAATGNSLQKTGGTNIWTDAEANSTRAIATGDGYVEFTPGENTTWRMIGLGNGNTSAHYNDIEYALFVGGGGGGLHVYESGVLRGSYGAYAGGDRLRVAVEGVVVRYYKNNNLLYTSAVAPTYPLLVDTSFNTVNAGIFNVKIAGWQTQ